MINKLNIRIRNAYARATLATDRKTGYQVTYSHRGQPDITVWAGQGAETTELREVVGVGAEETVKTFWISRQAGFPFVRAVISNDKFVTSP